MILGLNQLIEKRESFQTDPRVEVWLVSQVELEHLRLIRSLDTYHHIDAQASLDDLLTRFDIYWSRLLVISEGAESQQLREIEGLDQTIEQVIATLEKIEPDIVNLEKDDRATLSGDPLGFTRLGQADSNHGPQHHESRPRIAA